MLGASLLVGVATYLATVRSEEIVSGPGFGHPEPRPASEPSLPGPGSGYAYLRVSTEGPSLRDRVQGFVGLVVLVGLAAAALALAIYQGGHLINVMIESFLGS